jgi:uncharacterized SAM-binding protein YcdF (DUF218 family)
MGFLIKKLIAPLFFPMSILVLLLAVGVGLLWFGKEKRAKHAKIVLTAGLGWLLLMTYTPVPGWLLGMVELREPAYALDGQSTQTVEYVVVLGGGNVASDSLPVSARTGDTSLPRIVEGIRLQRLHPGSKLLLSGGAVFAHSSDADAMRDLAVALGVDPADIIVEDQSKDTQAQASVLKDRLGQEPFVLVTSASHIPRAAAMFRKHGMQPIPAPTGHNTVSDPQFRLSPAILYPNVSGPAIMQTAVYEYMGLLWAKLRGYI